LSLTQELGKRGRFAGAFCKGLDKEIIMEIKTVGIVGAGQMGNGIAQVAAMSGLEVVLSDIKTEFVERGLEIIKKNLQRSVDKDRMTAEKMDAVLKRIKTSIDIKDMSSSDFVVEAATEHEPIKFQIFKDLDQTCAPHVILATNTSSIPIGRIAACTKRPEKIIGMHFMNPVPVMKLVEVIRGLATSDDTTWRLNSEKHRLSQAITPDLSPTGSSCP